MNDDVLKEFLVSLGFKIDETALKKFSTALHKVEAEVFKLGATVAAAAAGVVTGVAVISHQMENLYYASQRTDETVGNLMSLRYAAEQIGLTSEQAQGAIEGFTRTLRLNPGTQGLLAQLGVTGNGPVERFESFIAKMKQMQPYIAAQYASLFGIDPDTLLMLENGLPKLQAEQQKYRDRLRAFGLDPEQAAEAGKDFDNSIRGLTTDFSLLWTVIESKLAPVLKPLIDQFERWEQSHAGDVADAIAAAVQNLANWIGSVNWTKVGKDIDDVVDELGGVKGILLILAGIKLLPLITGVLNLAGAITRLGTAAAGAGLGVLAKVLGPLALLFHSEDLNQGESDRMTARQQQYADVDPNTVDWNGPINGGISSTGAMPSDKPQQQSGGSISAPRGIRNNNPGNIRGGAFASSMGATGIDNNGFAVFSDMQSGSRAAVQLLQSYMSRGYDTIRKVISRWAPSSENNTSGYIDDVVKQLGIGPDQKLGADQAGSLAQAIFGHENGAKYANMFSNTRLGANGVAASRSVTIHQETNINMSGSSDPDAAARAVSNEQRRVNGDLVRNFSGAVT